PRRLRLLCPRRHRDPAAPLDRSARLVDEGRTDPGAAPRGAFDPRGPVMVYFALKYLHLIGATVLLGTGAGIAFFMLMAHRTGDAAIVAAVARMVVIADVLFTATAVVAQPVSGVAL